MITLAAVDNAYSFKMHELHGSVAVTFPQGEPVITSIYSNFDPNMPEITPRTEITFQGQSGVWTCSASDGVIPTLFRQ